MLSFPEQMLLNNIGIQFNTERESERGIAKKIQQQFNFLPNCDIEPPLIASEIKKEAKFIFI